MSCFNVTTRSLFSQSSSALNTLSRHSRVLPHDTRPFVVQKRGKRTRGFPGLLQNALKREERHLNVSR